MKGCRTPKTALGGLIAAVTLAVALVGCNCDESVEIVEYSWRVLEGTPLVGEGLSGVDHRQPVADADDFTYSASIRVDVFRQDYVRKVDILWMVDNSASMSRVQGTLGTNVASFFSDLAEADPPVDYHVGVITPDTLTEGGALRPISGFPGLRYISCNSPDLVGECNVGTLSQAQAAFRDTVMVGAEGDPVERGLLAVHLAVSEPMASTSNAGFLRDDAALYVIVVSDEGDMSCDPIVVEPTSGDHRECTNAPNCRCATEEDLEEDEFVFGSVDYFVRHLNVLKGYGKDNLVTVAAIVGDDREDIVIDDQWLGSNTYRGCRNQVTGVQAIHAPRYETVAQRTGGVIQSICDEDFSEALSEIGFRVSGLKTEFRLSRSPIDHEEIPFRVTLVIEEDGRRTRSSVPHVDDSDDGEGWRYVRCDGGVAVNAVHFSGRWIPPPRSLVEVAYTSDVGGQVVCE